MFLCGAPNCETKAKSDAALTRHRKGCTKWMEHQTLQIAARRERGSSNSPGVVGIPNKKRKVPPGSSLKTPVSLQQRKQRANSSEPTLPIPGPSFTARSPSPDEDVPMAFFEADPVPFEAGPVPVFHAGSDSEPPAQLGRPKRDIRKPARYRDILPQPLQPANDPVPTPAAPTLPALPRISLIVRDTYNTAVNMFGLWRSYLHRPSYDPDLLISFDDLSTQFSRQHATSSNANATPSPPAPKAPKVMSWTTTALIGWLNNGHATKSEAQMDLLADIIRDPRFNAKDLEDFKASRANKQVDEASQTALPLFEEFRKTSVEITVPSGASGVPSRTFAVPGLYYRPLVSVIKAAFQDPLSKHFHFSPFKLYHRARGSDRETRVLSEIYNSDAYIKEHDHIQRHGKLPPDDLGCKREKALAGLMGFSDSTHLANFGTAKLWPIYLFFANLSKYFRVIPEIGAENHLAYIPSLPDAIQDEISKFHAKWTTQKAEILAHCRRELFHAVWKLLLDDDFCHAYTYGIVIKCADGIERRVYPRFFTYSADYPEKVLIATIRDNGKCPCPRCLTSKSLLNRMGLIRDLSARITGARKYLADKIEIARRCIYDLAMGIKGVRVEDLLSETSSVPTLNAFIERLGDDFNLHQMLVVDFMHEFELGVWKNLFTHLIRLLYALPNGKERVAELDRRYRQMPRFGTDTIRRFATNASEMKKLGARDFEDLLQCAIPAFDGLFPPEHNDRVLKLLYRMAEWHAAAKLRMHTDPTLEHLRKLTPEIGRLMRDFKNTTCSEFNTVELPRETAARARREQRASETAGSASRPQVVPADTPAPVSASVASAPASKQSKKKTLNLNTYKWHALGDYVRTIELFGPTDSYSTQLGESLHRQVKRMYSVTNKREHEKQIAMRYMRLKRARVAARTKRRHAHHGRFGEEPLGYTPPDVHHHTSNARRCPIDLYRFIPDKSADPAVAGFLPKLQDHLLGRIRHRDFDGDTHDEFTHADRQTLFIVNNTIYATKTLRVNFTTYDVRRDRDTLNPRFSAFLMVRSPEDEPGAHPYWYCQLLGVFHTTAFTASSIDCTAPESMEFLWVRWLGVEPGYRAGIKRGRLPKVGFVHESDPYAFGFLDPAQVIRGCHLIPVFAGGRTNDLLATRDATAARAINDTEDWMNYYVDIFADRDMFMRYLGGGVGHVNLTVVEEEEDSMQVDNVEVEDGPREAGDREDSGDDSDSDEEDDEDGEEEPEEDGEDDDEFGLEEEEEIPEDDTGFGGY